MLGTPRPDDRHGRRGAEAWPAWFGPLALVVAFAGIAVFSAVIAIVAVAAGADRSDLPPGVELLATFVQDLAFVSAAVFFASRLGRVTPGDFGLRPTPVGGAAALTLGGLATFYAIAVLYEAVASPDGGQDVVQTLGAKESTPLLIGSALLVIGIAPFCEELLFRGFFYRALRNRFSVAVAVGLVASLFGAIHYTGSDTLPLLPLLALLGAIFCLVYERTGSLWPAIAIHIVNNAIALAAAVGTGSAVAVSAAVGAAGLVVCGVGVSRRGG